MIDLDEFGGTVTDGRVWCSTRELEVGMDDLRAQAEAGAPEAMLALALRLEAELDPYADNTEAEREIGSLLLGAAGHGLPRALAELGSFLWHVEENDEEALPWLLRAADMGQVDAMSLLGDIHDFLDERDTAITWYHKAAEHGDKQAAENLDLLRRGV
jgi:TPR repeat protein